MSGRVRLLGGALDDYLRRAGARSYPRFPCEGSPRSARLRERRNLSGGAAIFERLGADVDIIASEPDGVNINPGCGSTHPEAGPDRITRGRVYDVGYAFDGDGDRVLAVDRRARVVDGDELIAHCQDLDESAASWVAVWS